MAETNIRGPFGKLQDLALAATGATAITIVKDAITKTTQTLTGAATLTVTADSELEEGAKIYLSVKATATEVLTFAGDIVAPVITGVAGKTMTQGFYFNAVAGKFYPLGASVQID